MCGCDHPDLDPGVLAELIGTVERGAEVAVARAGADIPQWLVSAWRTEVTARLQRRFDAGERSPHRAVAQAGLRVEFVAAPEWALADIDSPDQLQARQHHLDRREQPA